MSPSIQVSDETKAKLEAMKRADETFDDLLERLAVERTETNVSEMAGGGGDGLAEHMAKNVRS